MKIGGSQSITFEFDNNHFNYLRLMVYTPFIYAKSNEYDLFAEEQKSCGVSFNTSLGLDLSAHHWEFHVLVLGFGIRLLRQWSY
jgi:hypothetical protein